MTKKPEARPRGKRRPERRTQIQDAAVALIARDGYHATGMNDIGAAVGITGPGIYRHFSSKEAILESALEQSAAEMLADVEAIIAATDGDPEQQLTQLVVLSLDAFFERHELLMAAIHELHNLSDEARATFGEAARHRAEEWARPLVELRPDLSPQAARFLVSSVQAMLISSSDEITGDMDPDRRRQLMYDLTMAALTRTGGKRGRGKRRARR